MTAVEEEENDERTSCVTSPIGRRMSVMFSRAYGLIC